MRSVIYILCIGLFFVGCDPQRSESIKQKNQKEETSKKIPQSLNKDKESSEVIVMFSKGVSMDEARQQIVLEGMVVAHVYKALSKNSNKPMLLIRSPFNRSKTEKMLKKNPNIVSVSYNHEIRIEPDPTKPQ
jgi:hypothetical protein